MSVGSFIAQSTVGRLRVRTAAGDLAVAGRCATAIAPLDLRPLGMPHHAILCVRALRDPLPGAIDVGRSGQQPAFAWEVAARSALGDALARAVRPARELVTSTSDAVFFADASELLACAARDAARGCLAERWWWEHLLPQRTAAGVVEKWRREPTFVPAGLERLAAIDPVSFAAFLRALNAPEALDLLERICRAFASPSLGASIVAALHSVRPQEASTHLGTPAIATALGSTPLVDPPARPPTHTAPWRGFAPIDVESLGLRPETQAFAGIGLAMRVAPAVVRSVAFRAAAVAHVEQCERDRGKHCEAAAASVASILVNRSVAAGHPHSRDAAMPESAARSSATRTPASAEAPSAPRGQGPIDTPAPRLDAGNGVPPSVRPPIGDILGDDAATPPGDLTQEHDTQTDASAERPVVAKPVVAIDAEAVLASDFAGVFFLLNVVDNLELYSVGVSERHDPDLPIWAFLLRAGREIAGKPFEADPVCGLLHELAGRMAASYLPVAPDPHTPPALVVEDAVVRVREHISAVIEVDDAPAMLLHQHGRIIHTPAHVEVQFALERHPIEIRAARLDRNPGWIRAAGRYVTFRFS